MNRENIPRVLAHCSRVIVLMTGAAGLLLSCHTGPRIQTTEHAGLSGKSYSSLKKLALATVAALNDSSKAQLSVLQVSFDEYRDAVWSRVPDERHANMPIELAWEWVERDSRVAISRTLSDLGGRKLRFLRVYVLDGVQEFPLIRIHRDVRIVATDKYGETHEFKFLNVVAEIDGRFKVVAFDS